MPKRSHPALKPIIINDQQPLDMGADAPVFVSVRSLAARYETAVNTVWRWVREGRYPKPIKLGPAMTRWRLDEVIQWERRQGRAD